jgi:hypothetical protein
VACKHDEASFLLAPLIVSPPLPSPPPPQLLLKKGDYFGLNKPAALSTLLPLAFPLAAAAAEDAEVAAHPLPLALGALGGMTHFLKECLLDRAVLPLGRLEAMPEVQWGPATRATTAGRAATEGGDSGAVAAAAAAAASFPEPAYMQLNGAALENLEVRGLALC